MNLLARNLTWIAIAANALIASTTGAVEIKLRERTAPHGSVVRLADVAEISGDDRDQARQLGALPLMPAPATGTQRFIRKREIQDMLAAQGIEVGDFHFVGSEQVTVVADAAEIENTSGRLSASVSSGQRMNRHAAILAGLAESETPRVGEARDTELRQQL